MARVSIIEKEGVGEKGVERVAVNRMREGLRFVRSRLASEVEGMDDDR